MVNGAGIGFVYEQQVAVIKQELKDTFIELAGDKFDIELDQAVGEQEFLFTYFRSSVLLSRKLIVDENIEYLKFIIKVFNKFLYGRISKVVQIDIDHERFLDEYDIDCTKIKIQIQAVRLNNNI